MCKTDNMDETRIDVSYPRNGEEPLLKTIPMQEGEEVKEDRDGDRTWVKHGSSVLVMVLTTYSIHYLKNMEEASGEVAGAQMVWASAWLTAVCTGFGAVPFLCLSDRVVSSSKRLVAIANAVAAGVMIAASIGLVAEGLMEPTTQGSEYVPACSVLSGIYLGITFIIATGKWFGDSEPSPTALVDVQHTGSSVQNMRRVLVIMAAMTLHAFSEGVGIGVAHRSSNAKLGGMVSVSLAIHNIPEGLAVAAVLIPRGFSRLGTTLLCIFTSLPQPIMAVPAYMFVSYFKCITPIGFGFAAGAMCHVAFFELLAEAQETLSSCSAYALLLISMTGMGLLQFALHEEMSL